MPVFRPEPQVSRLQEGRPHGRPSFLRSSTNGFTLIEVILVFLALGILATLIVPRVLNALPWANTNQAQNLARTVNMGIAAYNVSVPNASGNWTAAATDEAKYDLVSGAGFLPQMSSTLSGLQPTSGYTLHMPSTITGMVTITDNNNNNVPYQ